MLLAIDVGNSQTQFGLYADARLVHQFDVATTTHRTCDEYGVLLTALLQQVQISANQLEAAVLASVVPPLTSVFRQLCERLGVPPLVVGPGVRTGMPVHYENARDVGADRIVNGVAAYERYRTATGGPHGVIVVDFATATICDVVSPKGEYVGGAIAPGVAISTEALFTQASKLPRVDLQVPSSAIGKSTVASMLSGIVFGHAGCVDGLVNRMRAELAFKPRVVATGMLAPLLAPHCQVIEDVDPCLTLEGLRLVHLRNQQGTRDEPSRDPRRRDPGGA